MMRNDILRRFRRLARRFALSVGLLGATVVPASAQSSCVTGLSGNSSCQVSVVISSTIQATRRLVVAPGTSFSLLPASGQLSPDDFVAGGFDASGALQLLVQSNGPWRVTLQATTGSMSGACTNKNASTIQWGSTPGLRTTPLSQSGVTVVSGGAFTSGATREVYLRVGLGWLTDGPVSEGQCLLPVSFAVGAP